MLESFGEAHSYDPVAVNSSVMHSAICLKNKQTQLSFPAGPHSRIIRCSSNSIVHMGINKQHING